MGSEELRISVPEGGELGATLDAPDGARACVVLGHGFGLPRQAGTQPLADALSAAGVAALRFDYRHINGGSGAEPRQLITAPAQREDWRAALARARRDFERIGIWGYSFGGARAIEMTAEDKQLDAAVARCPNSNVFATMANLGLGRMAKVAALATRDQVATLRGRAPVTAPIADREHPAALFYGDQSDRYLATIPAGSGFENAYCTRLLLKTSHLWAGRLGRRIDTPMLVVVGNEDEVTPPKPALRFAARAGAETLEYEGDHFSAFLDGAVQARVVEGEAGFLARHLAN
jgi:hypothetical protein